MHIVVMHSHGSHGLCPHSPATCTSLDPSPAPEGTEGNSMGPSPVLLNCWLLADYGREAVIDFTCILIFEPSGLQWKV